MWIYTTNGNTLTVLYEPGRDERLSGATAQPFTITPEGCEVPESVARQVTASHGGQVAILAAELAPVTLTEMPDDPLGPPVAYETFTVKELRELAAFEGVALGNARTKAQIIGVMRAQDAALRA